MKLQSQQKTEKKPPFIFYLIMILLPFLFLIILETSLRISDYGKDLSTWIKVDSNKYGMNPDLAFRYFYNVKNVPTSIQDVFDITKKENSFRVFVFGGSSAAGYPYMPLGSFSRYIKRRLEIFYPNKTIEVVNLSLTAVNSYTIRDLVPEVLEQKPDLILIYAGHNEYYGALGVGSMESLGKSRGLVNFILSLNKFKTTQLVRNFLKYTASLFNGEQGPASGTLMSRMAQEQSIEYASDVYNAGIEQFRGNMSDVLETINKANVPVIISTLVSNLKDQKPFVSKKASDGNSADDLFDKAQKLFSNGDIEKSDKLFRLAKDYDMLRFRAPEKINDIIKEFDKIFKVNVIDADKGMNNFSENKIVGDDLMVDHLHLNLRGYKHIGKLFFEEMISKELLPSKLITSLSETQQDSVTLSKFYFSPLDSITAEYKIKLLKNDWPFVQRDKKFNESILLNPKNFIDSIAFDIVTEREQWETGERKAAAWYLVNKNYEAFTYQMDVLINQFPIIREYYNFTANELIKVRKFSAAYKYLIQKYYINPDAFTTKWLGIISLAEKKTEAAIKYLEESVKLKNDDPQTLYNLSGAYASNNNYQKALLVIIECLKVKPDYAEALAFRNQLEKVTDSK
ncbi:MAG: hypothetical protein CVV23_00810 [Ignavibacteriae bacterium HGW-Ignavibacteriae-2]|nr:MAG: hypothetical protein CVV23_00810 [Ignavibacteriae bacterium HGW-Ignavibacteriae-2]